MKTLRPYQSSALKNLWLYLHQTETNPLVVAPVGAGKSLLIAEFIRQVHEKEEHCKILVLAHDKRLLEQNMEELREQYPLVDAGYYCAGLKQKRLTNDVTFASIQSVHSKAALFDRAPRIILVDEAHLISKVATGRYRKFISDCEALNPRVRTIGFTGSPYRTDSGLLHKGKDRLFDAVCYEIPIGEMIEDGYLARPVLPRETIKTKMDVTGVGMRGGDYIENQLDEAVNTEAINAGCVGEIIAQGSDRKAWLVYTVTKNHCDNVVMEFVKRGVNARGIHSSMPADVVKENIADFKAGKVQCLVNVAMLTTGFNHPPIDLLAYMRPTRSPVLYMQCTGRGLRTVYADGYNLDTKQGRLDAIENSQKKDCLIMDFGGVIAALGAIDNIDLSSVKNKNVSDTPAEEEKPEVIFCPKCEAPCYKNQKYCYECGYQLIEDADPNIGDTPDTQSAILAKDIQPEKLSVIDMTLSKHRKKTPEGAAPATPVMKVTYHTYAGNINEWVCFEHDGGALFRAKKWHDLHMPELKGCYPLTIDLAVSQHKESETKYKTPAFIYAKKKGKYWNLTGDKDFDKPQPELALSDEELDEYTGLI